MRVFVAILFMIPLFAAAQTASAQVYDLNLTIDGVSYGGQFTYSFAPNGLGVFSDVNITGNGFTFNSGDDPEQAILGNGPGDDQILFTTHNQDDLFLKLVAPLGGRESTFTEVSFLWANGSTMACNPGPDTCSVLSLVLAPELDVASLGGVVALMCCGFMMFAPRRVRKDAVNYL
jgi:hypothetical protein